MTTDIAIANCRIRLDGLALVGGGGSCNWVSLTAEPTALTSSAAVAQRWASQTQAYCNHCRQFGQLAACSASPRSNGGVRRWSRHAWKRSMNSWHRIAIAL